jgi:hypothetical protein
MGAAMSACLVMIGDRLGLYKAMVGAGPMTPADLAKKTGTRERYIREWLLNQAAGGYVASDAQGGPRRVPLLRHGAVLRGELPREPGRVVDPGA